MAVTGGHDRAGPGRKTISTCVLKDGCAEKREEICGNRIQMETENNGLLGSEARRGNDGMKKPSTSSGALSHLSLSILYKDIKSGGMENDIGFP